MPRASSRPTARPERLLVPERLGLALARALDRDLGLQTRLCERLRKTAPETAAAKLTLLEHALSDKEAPAPHRVSAGPEASKQAPGRVLAKASPGQGAGPVHQQIRPGIWLETGTGAMPGMVGRG